MQNEVENPPCTAFANTDLLAAGDVAAVAKKVKEFLDQEHAAGRIEPTVLIFDDATSRPVEIDFRGTVADVLARLTPAAAPRGPGRPKLGVTAREVTLLPRHWEWLSEQPGGASVALRKLVEDARRAGTDADRSRRAQEATYRFMTAIAGNLPGFEEATRALFAGDHKRFDGQIKAWPAGIRTHAKKLAAPALTK